ncbi:phosphatase PAP2 family protein [Alteromonas gracilis]|uniref:phosphatase PAP2 family protein n=1 Tax=Alteromonas gracilis TaxID=1479524 RepID=UPI00373542DE
MKNITRSDFILVLGGLALAGCLWGFLEIAGMVTSGGTAAVDEKLLLLFRTTQDLSDPIGAHWVEELMRDITGLGGVGILTFFTLASAVYMLLIKKPKMALFIVVAIVSGTLLSFALKYGFDRPRPDLVPHGSYVYTHSFPSGHSLMSALVYFTLATLLSRVEKRKRVKIFLLSMAALLTVSIGISRVYLGVHWPSDVLAGWTVGVFWSILSLMVASSLQSSGDIEQEGDEESDEVEETLHRPPD